MVSKCHQNQSVDLLEQKFDRQGYAKQKTRARKTGRHQREEMCNIVALALVDPNGRDNNVARCNVALFCSFEYHKG